MRFLYLFPPAAGVRYSSSSPSVQKVYIRRVERIDGQVYNVEFDVMKDVKDPAKDAK